MGDNSNAGADTYSKDFDADCGDYADYEDLGGKSAEKGLDAEGAEWTLIFAEMNYLGGGGGGGKKEEKKLNTKVTKAQRHKGSKAQREEEEF